jgi:DNA repair exonuclease SbcCD ATPase subunit
MIKINDLLKNERSQLIILGELLIFLSTISSKVDYWLDKLGELDEKFVNAYCLIADKYLTPNNKLDESLISSYGTNKNNENNNHPTRSHQSDKLLKKVEELEKEKLDLMKNMQDVERENSNYKEKYLLMERNYTDLEFKYKDCSREVELYKNSSKSNFKVQEELLQESIEINGLKAQISQKDMEIEDIRRENALILKAYTDEIQKLKEKLDIYEDKISSYKNLANENDKLKIKIKELSLLKEKQHEFDENVLNLESKQRMIDSLIKEKQGYINQIEKLNKDILAEREKFRQSEFEKKKMEFELNDLKKENYRMEMQLKNKEIQTQNMNALNEMKRNSMNSEYNNEKPNNYLWDLDQSSVIYEIDKTKEDRIKLLEKEIEELRTEKTEIIRKYNNQSEETNKILADKEKISSQFDEINLELKKMINERDKALLEKEKLLLKMQKFELDMQKIEINGEIEKKKVEDELRETLDKLRKITNEKLALGKEFDNAKKDYNENVEKMLKERQSLMTEHQKDLEKLRGQYEKESKIIY